jgi:hypothetical protein
LSINIYIPTLHIFNGVVEQKPNQGFTYGQGAGYWLPVISSVTVTVTFLFEFSLLLNKLEMTCTGWDKILGFCTN